MDSERTDVFIEAYSKGFPEYLERLETEALNDNIPIIRKDSQNLLRFLLTVKKPKNILEIGTAVGYSTLLMAEYSPKECNITTVENYPPRIAKAKEHFSLYDINHKITLLEGDAGEHLKKLTGEYDFIFLDGPKGQYEAYLDDILRLMPTGGILVTDNILKEGEMLESRYAVTRRNRTIHARMRDYLLRLKNEETLENVIWSSEDGMTLSVKRDIYE